MKFRISNLLMLTAIAALALGWWMERKWWLDYTNRTPTDVRLPRDYIHSAVEARFGPPDEVTGSGRSFVHYDLKTDDRITIIISGSEIIGLIHTPKEKRGKYIWLGKKRHQPADASKSEDG